MFLRTRKRYRRLGYLSVACLAAFVVEVAHADVLVLRNGQRYEGVLANREVVRNDPASFSHVSFLAGPQDQEPALLSFPVTDIEYVLLEDGGEKSVIDFRQANAALSPTAESGSEKKDRREAGIALIVGGVVIGIVGIAKPFGEPTSGGGTAYNGLNYGLIIGGAILIIAGVTIAEGTSQTSQSAVGFRSIPSGGAVAMGWKF